MQSKAGQYCHLRQKDDGNRTESREMDPHIYRTLAQKTSSIVDGGKDCTVQCLVWISGSSYGKRT
jgi:hypothetical protein